MSNLNELEQRKRELELQRDIRRLERGAAVNEAYENAKEKAPGVGRFVKLVVVVAACAFAVYLLVAFVAHYQAGDLL